MKYRKVQIPALPPPDVGTAIPMRPEGITFGWTQPICERDWINQNSTWEPYPEGGPDAVRLIDIRQPVRVEDDLAIETCAWCGSPTIFGVYLRADPATVPFPRPKVLE